MLVTGVSKISKRSIIRLGLEKNLMGNTIRGNRTESFREENLPLRGSPKTSERSPFCDLIFITMVYLSEVFGGPLGDPLGGRFSSRRVSVLLPLIVFPLTISLIGVVLTHLPGEIFRAILGTFSRMFRLFIERFRGWHRGGRNFTSFSWVSGPIFRAAK